MELPLLLPVLERRVLRSLEVGGRESIFLCQKWSDDVVELNEGIVGSGNELDVLCCSSI